MKNGVCIKCKSTKVNKVKTQDRGQESFFSTSEANVVHEVYDPNRIFFSDRSVYYPLEGWACFECGYVEFYMRLS
jgi:predicted nucleic-acid-binding Zn-ribbon protein